MRRLASGLFLALLLACGRAPPPGHSVAANDYDRACANVADCVPVYEGILSCCSDQPCPNSAIRQDKIAIYTSDVAAGTPMCAGPITPGSCLPPPPCGAGRVACLNGVCTLEFPSGDGGAGD